LSFLLFDLIFLSPFDFPFFFCSCFIPVFMWFHLYLTPTYLGIKYLVVVVHFLNKAIIYLCTKQGLCTDKEEIFFLLSTTYYSSCNLR
jgi:hypothetical protein